MTATDRARFFAGEYPRKPRPRLRNTCHYSGRVSVTWTTYRLPWQITIPGQETRPKFATYAEAIFEAQRLANIRAVRAIVDGAS